MFGIGLFSSKNKITYHDYMQRAKGQRRRTIGYLTVAVKRKDANEWAYLCKNKHNLGTDVGEDLLHRQMYINTAADSSGGFGANYIALSTNAGGASAAHTALAGEITTNGLQRVGGASLDVKSHTASTNVSTLEETFTASGTHTSVQLTGLFNNAVGTGTPSGGVLTHENTFTSTTLASGDELKVTWTITSTF